MLKIKNVEMKNEQIIFHDDFTTFDPKNIPV